MASTAISAQGSTIKVDDVTPGTPDVTIGNVTSFNGFDGEAAEIEITNLSSTAKERISGLADNGSFTMEIHPDYDDPGQIILRAAEASQEQKTFLLTLRDGKTIKWDGHVRNASSISGSVDSALTGSVSLTVKGDITIT